MATIAHFVSVTHNASFGLVAFLRMIGTETENYPSPAAILKSTPPPDDAGAATNDRFDWQAAMATADVFAAYFDCLNDAGLVIEGSMFEVLCEHHEDWALVKGHAAEIISAKHRETQVGPLRTLRMLLDEGGVLHLFDRWLALNRTPTCRLVTTAGVSGEALSLVEAAEAISSALDGGDGQYDEIVAKFGLAIAQVRHAKLDGSRGDMRPENLRESPESVIAFLSMFKVQDSQPSREYVGLMAPQAYVLPVARRLGCEEAAEAIWNAVMGVVRERMRAAGRTRRGRLPSVLGARDESGFEARTISLQEVVIIVQFAVANRQGFQPLPRRIRTSRVAIKMTTGGCSDNAVERAEVLRLQYRQHWREARGTPMIKPTQRRLENTLLGVVDEATDKVRLDGIRWGRALWWELHVRLERFASTRGAQGLDRDLLLGGVSELSNDCKAWFSDRFDLDEARRLAAEATS